MSSYPEEGVIQTYMEMTGFFPSFPINTFNSLAERQVKFKIVLRIVSYSLLMISKELPTMEF